MSKWLILSRIISVSNIWNHLTVCKQMSSHHHHHHHIVLAAQISLTLSRHSSLSFIALGRSSGQQPVSSHSCWMYVRAGRPAFARPYVGIHKSTSLMSSSLLLQQCPAFTYKLFAYTNTHTHTHTHTQRIWHKITTRVNMPLNTTKPFFPSFLALFFSYPGIFKISLSLSLSLSLPFYTLRLKKN